jgi:hypothetical protein
MTTEKKTAEETLKDEISDYYWHILEDEITFPDHEKTLKLRIIEAMEAYSAQQVAEATKDCYPKKYTQWLLDGTSMNLDELFDYWTKNVKKC